MNKNKEATKEYKKARKKLQSRVRSLKKRGYIVPDDLIPKIPKKVTEASTRRIERINKNIYKKVTRYVDGKRVSGVVAREYEKKQRHKPFIGIVQSLTDFISSLQPKTLRRVNIQTQKNMLLEILSDNLTYNEMLGSYTDYLRYLAKHEQEIYDTEGIITYASNQGDIITAITGIAKILNETPLEISVLADLSDFSESLSHYE